MHTDIYALVHAVAAPPPPYQQRQMRTRTLKDLRPNENTNWYRLAYERLDVPTKERTQIQTTGQAARLTKEPFNYLFLRSLSESY